MIKNFRWIGLTGGIGSGKSTVARLFVRRGVPVLDADQIAKQVVAKGTIGFQEVVRAFGPEVVRGDGELDRSKLGQLVFGHSMNLGKLESIVHPLVQEEVKKLKKELISKGHRLGIYDVPLLYEKNMKDQFDGVIVVWCSPELQVKRLKVRDQLTESDAMKRLKSQLPLESKKSQSLWLIENNGTLEQLESNFEEIYKIIQSGIE